MPASLVKESGPVSLPIRVAIFLDRALLATPRELPAAHLRRAFSLQPSNVVIMFLLILYPTPWQKKMLWNAITSLSLLVIAGIVVFTLYVTTQILAFLQPLLLAGSGCRSVRIFAGTGGQLAGP